MANLSKARTAGPYDPLSLASFRVFAPWIVESSPWLMRVEGALAAHFFQPDGTSRPGTDWVIGLKRGADVTSVRVRAYLSEDVAPALRDDTAYQAHTVMGYLDDLLRQGWTPDQPREHVIVIQNPAA